MMSPGIMQALARERENEIARRAARPRPMRIPDAPRAGRVRNRLAVAFGNHRRERRATNRATEWGTGRP
jgi:hypothetical protein